MNNLFDHFRLRRNTDPVSSSIAAIEVVDEGTVDNHEAVIIAACNLKPLCTAREQAVWTLDRHGVSYEQSHKRYKLAEDKGLISRGGVRKCRVSGRLATIWYATTEIQSAESKP